MDVLRNLFGNVTSGIIRLAVAVGILAAAYLFIVRPVLDTTNNAIDSANKSFEKSFGTPLDLNNIDKTIENANRQVQVQIRRSFHVAKKHGGANADRLIRCIQHAGHDVQRIQRCTRRF
jgi:hypothetical protein